MHHGHIFKTILVITCNRTPSVLKAGHALRTPAPMMKPYEKEKADLDERIVLRASGLAFWAHADVRVARAAGCSVGEVLEHGLQRGARLTQCVAVDRVRAARAGRLDQGLGETKQTRRSGEHERRRG